MEDRLSKSFTVFLVEDQRIDAKLIKFCITRLPFSLSVEHAATSDEAFQYIENFCIKNQLLPPDLILLDLNLPGHGGHSILKKIRSNQHLKFVPVVIFSTSSYDEDILACYEAGANSYIVKPSHFCKFRSALERAVTYWLDVNNNVTLYR